MKGRTDVRTDVVRTDVHDVISIKPIFLTSMGYHIFLSMVLRARAPSARAELRYNYNLASFLVNALKPISTNQFTIKDSFSFVDWAKTHQHKNEIMCSFDVCSLFTNVPLDETIEAIEICLTKLYSLPDLTALPTKEQVC